VAIFWDSELDRRGRDALELHVNHASLVEEHVMRCRKANLYNETFNYNSMTDVVWSYPLLNADLRSYVGHALCLDSVSLQRAKDFLSGDPIIQSLTGGDLTSVFFYRWRHFKDYTLRRDDGREGNPYLLFQLDRTRKGAQQLRQRMFKQHLEYLIRSERVVMAGPLHLPTEHKNDPNSKALGSIVVVNARDREDAIRFAEEDPCAKAGLYQTIKVHKFNNLDVTGKFVTYNRFKDEHDDMKEALRFWGYPVDDDQTPWLNC